MSSPSYQPHVHPLLDKGVSIEIGLFRLEAAWIHLEPAALTRSFVRFIGGCVDVIPYAVLAHLQSLFSIALFPYLSL